MGKAQSKRSVDITTDPKKDGTVDEGTGEMKKIEDLDQLKPQENGDTHHNENEDKDKILENGETENEKDLSTEKENQKQSKEDSPAIVSPDAGAGGDVAESTANENIPTTVGEQSTDTNETLNDSKNVDSTLAETGDSSKKPKKEKVKKKWSFRSISFGKKDKQKPSKKDDTANTSAVNGDCEKVPEETTTEESKPTEEKTELTSPVTGEADVPLETTDKLKEENKTSTVETEEKDEKLETTNEVKSDTVVTNGSDVETKIVESPEPVKEIEQHSSVEVISSSNDKPESSESEKLQQATVASMPLTNGTEHHDTEEPKLNGSIESPKIEVKCEEKSSVVDIQQNSNNETNEKDNNNLILSETESHINNLKVTSDISNIVNKDDEIDPLNPKSILSSPPPPLPCSPPPSQVMVFALSETKKEQQPIVDEILKEENIIDSEKYPKKDIYSLVSHIDNALNEKENKEEILTSNTENMASTQILIENSEQLQMTEMKTDSSIIEENSKVQDELNKEISSVIVDDDQKNETQEKHILELNKESVVSSEQVNKVDSELPEEVLKSEKSDIKLVSEELKSSETNEEIQNCSTEEKELVKQEETIALAVFDNNVNEIVETIALIEDFTDTIKSASNDLLESVTTSEGNEHAPKDSIENIVQTLQEDKETGSTNVNESCSEIIQQNNDNKPKDSIENNVIPTIQQDNETEKKDSIVNITSSDQEDKETASKSLNESVTKTIQLENENTSKDLVENFKPSVQEIKDTDTKTLNENNTDIAIVDKDKILSQNLVESIQSTVPDVKNVLSSVQQETETEIKNEEVNVIKSDSNLEQDIKAVNIENLAETQNTMHYQDIPVSSFESSLKTTIPDIEGLREEKSENDVKITVNSLPDSNLTSEHNISDKNENINLSSEIETVTTTQIIQEPDRLTNETNQNKENGLEGNHDNITEISATESLNGMDHKIIEDIKSENQIEKVDVIEVTQETPATVAE